MNNSRLTESVQTDFGATGLSDNRRQQDGEELIYGDVPGCDIAGLGCDVARLGCDVARLGRDVARLGRDVSRKGGRGKRNSQNRCAEDGLKAFHV